MLWLSIAEDVYTIQIGGEDENIRYDVSSDYVFSADNGQVQSAIRASLVVSRLGKRVSLTRMS